MLSYAHLLTSAWLVFYANPIDGSTLPITEGPNLVKKANSIPTSAAAATSTVSGGATVQTPVQRIFLDTDTCSNAQQKVINQAWEDAGLLAQAAASGRLDYDYTIPKTQWFAKLHTPNAPGGTWTYLSCPQQHEVCTPRTIAASADARGVFWINHYTIFCPLFFTKDSLSTSLARVHSNPQEQEVMDNYWGSQGYSYFHETYHYVTTVSQPRCQDLCYQAASYWEMAADARRGTGWAYYNADSYTLEAMAIYAQQYFNTPRPPVPRKYTVALTQTNDTLYQEAANPSNSTPPTTPDPISDAPAQPTQYYKSLDSVPEDLFNTTDNINAAGTNLNPRWKLMVGPPTNGTSDLDPSACVYTVTSEIGVTTSADTIQPTIATMCWCGGSVIAGIQTVTTSSTSYLVCEVPSSITISILGAATTALSPPPATSSPNMSSTACEACETVLGDSSCAASDVACLQNQCTSDRNCQTCEIDCSTVGVS